MTDDTFNIVWQSGVDDGTWHVKVVRLEPYKGQLTITNKDGAVIHTEEVGLSYDALFGPDVADVGEWQGKALQVIDSQS